MDIEPLCPDCGASLETLDEPCPSCGSTVLSFQDTIHRHWKTFRNRTSHRYRPDEFVQDVNQWMSDQRGLLAAQWRIHRSREGLVRGVTLDMAESAVQVPWRLQFARVPLVEGLLGRNRKDLGEALNAWTDRNPNRRLQSYVILSSAGVDVELWVLFSEPRVAELLAPPDMA
jgi:hypothetical protein